MGEDAHVESKCLEVMSRGLALPFSSARGGLRVDRGIELIAPHLSSRSRKTEDGRPLRRYRRPWLLERLFAWLQNYPRLVTRWERRAENCLGPFRLGCICSFFRHL